MDIRAVIFDLDGPILDSFREGLRRIKTICAVYDIPFRREHQKELTRLWGLPGVELLVGGLGVSRRFAEETLYPAWERLDLKQPVPLVLRSREVLFWLRRNKIACTVLTSRHREHVMEMFDRLDLVRDFPIISTKHDSCDETGKSFQKPDPRVFRPTLEALEEKFQIAKEQCVFVGDTPADVDAGRAVGIETLLVQTGPYLLKHADTLLLPLGNVLNSIDDVPGWIEEHDDNPSRFTSYE